jgi:signal transduction histidine kinase
MALVNQSLELYGYFEGRDPGKAAEKMVLAKRATREALEATRNLSRALSAAEATGGLQAALSDLLRDVAPPWIAHDLIAEGDESAVSPEALEQLFQIMREAVRNALAHSGCERLAVRLRITGDEAIGVVEDDGRGFGPEESRQEGTRGLDFMAERARLVGGTCRVGSSALGGTRVEVVVPLRP